MDGYAQIIAAIASLLWPLVVLTGLLLFKADIKAVLHRLRRGKVMGQEIELADTLDALESSASAASAEVASLPPLQDLVSAENGPNTILVAEVAREASRSPKAALIFLASEIEKEARQLVASIGHLDSRAFMPLSKSVDILGKQFGGLPPHIPSSLKYFWDVRSRIVHGLKAEDDEILRAIDSGITILNALRAFPKEINVVYHPGVDIYADEDCNQRFEGSKGVILETESPGGMQRTYRIFPTTKAHFKKGKRVAWEWSHDHSWGPAWYRDPDTGEIKRAWLSSMEFTGRHLDDV